MNEMRLATDGQMARLLQIKAKKQLAWSDVQALIDKSKFPPKSSDRHLPYWEYRFPGQGALLFRALQPFYDWDQALKPALPDLDRRLYEAFVAKLSLRGVRAVCQERAFQVRHEYGWELNFAKEIRMAYWPEVMDDDRIRPKFRTLRLALAEEFKPLLETARLPRYEVALLELLLILCVAALLDRTEVLGEISPLLDFWLAGNIPMGIDAHRVLVVLVAD